MMSVEPTYGIKVETEDGLYIIEVDVVDRSGSRGSHTAYNLAAALDEGDEVLFKAARGWSGGFTHEDRIGILDPDDILKQ